MRIVVTGHAGLVGRSLSDALRRSGHEVLGVDLRAIEGSAGDFRGERMRQMLEGPVDGVIHLAAISRVAWGEADPALCHAINVEGTRILAEAMRERAPDAWLLFASSREVYGDPDRPLVREDDPLEPVNHYGRSKLEGEHVVAAARDAGMRTAIVRLCNVYGAREDHPDRAVPSLVTRAAAGEPLTLTGGDCYFDFVHVRDVVSGILRLVALLGAGESSVPTVHLATGRATTLRQLADVAIRATGSASSIHEVEARSFDVGGFCGAPDFAEQVLGWRASVPLEQGLAEVAEDIRANGPLAPFPLSALS